VDRDGKRQTCGQLAVRSYLFHIGRIADVGAVIFFQTSQSLDRQRDRCTTFDNWQSRGRQWGDKIVYKSGVGGILSTYAAL
jgi:hypothetical protein